MKITKAALFVVVAITNISIALWAKIPGDVFIIVLLGGVMIGAWIGIAVFWRNE